MRDKLQARKPVTTKPEVQNTNIRFGSFNVNGLDLEVGWAIEQLLSNRGFDVRATATWWQRWVANFLKNSELGCLKIMKNDS